MPRTIKIAFLERTGGVAAEVAIEETGDTVDAEKLLKDSHDLADRAQALAFTMGASKQMRGLR